MTQPADEPEGHLHPTSAASLWLAWTLGLVLGWLLRPVMVRVTGSAPYVTWAQGLALFFVAALLAFVAWDTWQKIQVKRGRLPGNAAVNRLVLARASALVGALVSGGYAGYAITWLGDPSELAGQRIAFCALAAAGGVLVTAASLALERACRVPPDEPNP